MHLCVLIHLGRTSVFSQLLELLAMAVLHDMPKCDHVENRPVSRKAWTKDQKTSRQSTYETSGIFFQSPTLIRKYGTFEKYSMSQKQL